MWWTEVSIISTLLSYSHGFISAAQENISAIPWKWYQGLNVPWGCLDLPRLPGVGLQESGSHLWAATSWEKNKNKEKEETPDIRNKEFRDARAAIICRLSVILPTLNSFPTVPFIVSKGLQGLVCHSNLFSCTTYCYLIDMSYFANGERTGSKSCIFDPISSEGWVHPVSCSFLNSAPPLQEHWEADLKQCAERRTWNRARESKALRTACQERQRNPQVGFLHRR